MTVEKKTASNRIAGLDRLRILAALGIVCFHVLTGVGQSIGHAGLPAFLMLSCALVTIKRRGEGLGEFTAQRAERLLMPWLFWSVVYLVFRLLSRAYARKDFGELFTLQTLLVGTGPHLWYLTYAFVMCVIVYVVHRRVMNSSPDITVVSGSILGLAFFLLSSLLVTSVPEPFRQWLFGLPAVPLGFVLGYAYLLLSTRKRRIFYIALVVAVVLESVLIGIFRGYELAVPYGVAVIFVCFAFLGNSRTDRLTYRWASLTFGIYLIHPLVISLFDIVGLRKVNHYMHIAAVFLTTSVVTLVLQKTPLRRFI